MDNDNYTIAFRVGKSSHEAFEAIQNVTGWWTENLQGMSGNLGDEFSVQFGDVHFSKQKLVEVIPDRRIVWLISESRLNFIKDKSEWTGTKVSFDISEKDGQTEVRFTHYGLIPTVECYGACSNAWAEYVQGSLYRLITTGEGKPTRK